MTIIQLKDEAGVNWTLDTVENTRSMRDDMGRLVTMDLGQSDVHIDAALSGYAARYTQWDGIAEDICPVVPSEFASAKYYTWDKDDVFQNVEDLSVAPGSVVKEVSPRLSTSSYTTLPYGLATAVPTEVQANADGPLNVELAATKRLMDNIGLAREMRVAALVTTSGNWTGGYTTTLGATAKWNNGTTSDPVADIYTAIESSLTPVTGLAMSERTFHAFIQNPNVQKYVSNKVSLPPLPGINAGNQANISSEFSSLLSLPPFKIGRQRKKTAASTYGYVWGNNVALVYASGGGMPMMTSPSTCKTFRWNGANGVPDGTVQGGFLVRSYFDPKRGARGSRIVVMTHNDAEIVTSTVAGGLIINAWA